jgi:hypothetical protein
MGEWISINERLPEYDTSVLLLVNGKMTQGYLFSEVEFNEMSMQNLYYDGFQNEVIDDVIERNDVTHWMPLPEPPKD